MSDVTRRRFLYSAIGGTAIGISYSCYFEPRWLRVTEQHVRLPSTVSRTPIRLLHVSDLHASLFVPMSLIEHAVNLGLEQKPDLVCITGDFITGRDHVDTGEYVRLLRRFSAAAPTFAVLGNHDGGIWAREHWGYEGHSAVERLLLDSGIELLHNRSASALGISLVGVGDLWSDEIQPMRAWAGARKDRPIVVLSHNPDSKEALGAFSWDLMLSGHTHGGQVVFPVWGPCYAPVQDRRYVEGLKRWDDRYVHVTRGVGNLGGVRFRCRPEISLLLLS
jgi:predicted MPP superfamily phosphohydrolase